MAKIIIGCAEELTGLIITLTIYNLTSTKDIVKDWAATDTFGVVQVFTSTCGEGIRHASKLAKVR